MARFIDITGQRFNKLVVVATAGLTSDGKWKWECQCDCGNTAIISGTAIRRGTTKSCGCIAVARAMQHVESNTRPIGFKRIKKQNGRPEIKTERGFVFEHVLVMEKFLGRRVAKGEVVHHKDGNKLNNNLDNLQIMTISEHTILHHTGAKRSPETCRAISRGISDSKGAVQWHL